METVRKSAAGFERKGILDNILEDVEARGDGRTAADIRSIAGKLAAHPEILEAVLKEVGNKRYRDTEYDSFRDTVNGLNIICDFIKDFATTFNGEEERALVISTSEKLAYAMKAQLWRKNNYSESARKSAETLSLVKEDIFEVFRVYSDVPALAGDMVRLLFLSTVRIGPEEVATSAKTAIDVKEALISTFLKFDEWSREVLFAYISSFISRVRDKELVIETLDVLSSFKDSQRAGIHVFRKLLFMASGTDEAYVDIKQVLSDIVEIREFIKEATEIAGGEEFLVLDLIDAMISSRRKLRMGPGDATRVINDAKDVIMDVAKEYKEIPELAERIIINFVYETYFISKRMRFQKIGDTDNQGNELKPACGTTDELNRRLKILKNGQFKEMLLGTFRLLEHRDEGLMAPHELVCGSDEYDAFKTAQFLAVKLDDETTAKEFNRIIGFVFWNSGWNGKNIIDYLHDVFTLKDEFEKRSFFASNPVFRDFVFRRLLDRDQKSPQKIMDILSESGPEINNALNAYADAEMQEDISFGLMDIARKTGDAWAVRYYARLFKASESFFTLARDNMIIGDAEFINVIKQNFKIGQDDPDKHAFAAIAYLYLGKNFENALKDVDTEAVMGTILDNLGITAQKNMTYGQKFLLLSSLNKERIINNAGNINKLVAARINGVNFTKELRETGFKKPNTGIIATLPLRETIEFDSIREAIDLLVIGIGIKGSLNLDTAGMREKLTRTFGEKEFGRALKAWAGVRKAHMAELRSAYNAFKTCGDMNAGIKIIDIFEKGSQEVESGIEKEALNGVIWAFREALGTKMLMVGSRMIAYTVEGKGNMMEISSEMTGCCALMPYSSEDGWINYAADNGIVLVNFSVIKTPFKAKLETLKVHGVAVAALGMASIRGREERILYVDSMEGGTDFKHVARKREGEIAGMLAKGARLVNADYVAFYTESAGYPGEFAKELQLPEENINIRLLLEEKQFLEGIRDDEQEYDTQVLVKLMRV